MSAKVVPRLGDQIIACMGPTGSGKSNLIGRLAQTNWSGTSLKSVTQEVRAVRVYNPNSKDESLVLVDTPGFDDTGKTDMQILQMISDWLTQTYASGVKLSGILYLHRITDNRMPGTTDRCLQMFYKLCGENTTKKVVLVTTIWDKLDGSDRVARAVEKEEQLKDCHWVNLISKGATTQRFDNRPETAWVIVQGLLCNHDQHVDLGRNLGKTQVNSYPWIRKKKQTLLNSKPSVKKINTELIPNDVIIALMGPTGSGKSSFIKTIIGTDSVQHNLESCTSEITAVRLSFPELTSSDIVFVDTPGFDDTNKSDVDIFKMISDWLNETYKKNIQLTGLLYFHRISANRMAGTPLKNLRMFEKLCGKKFHNIVLTTTMWDEVDPETGNEREKELMSVYWKGMISRGSRVSRFDRERSTAFKILSPLIDEVNKTLLLQKEMTDMGSILRQTSTGAILFLELEHLVKCHQEMLARIREEANHPSIDERLLEIMMQEYSKITEKLENASEEMVRMGVPMGEQFKKAFISSNWRRAIFLFTASTNKIVLDTSN